MTSFALRPLPSRISRHSPSHRGRHGHLPVDDRLVSVAGAIGSTVVDSTGARVATLDDLIVLSTTADQHPPLAGAVVRLHRQRLFVPSEEIRELSSNALHLRGSLAGRPLERKASHVALAHDVLDHQIVDIDGTQVVRVSDLVLAGGSDGIRLVGADVSARTLLLRLWPVLLRRRVSTERVFDWASVAAFSERGADGRSSVLHLTQAAAHLRERGPTAIEALLEDLPSTQRVVLADGVSGQPAP
jgi:sporulation protein YlmC with PRC-barrel domain